MNNINEIKELLIDLSDEIDMHDYRSNWKEKSQELITKITNLIKNKENTENSYESVKDSLGF